jgi:hypothetical protein
VGTGGDGGFDWLFWRVVSTFTLSEGEGYDGSITLADAKRPLNLREGKNDEEAVLTSYSPTKTTSIRSSAPVNTSLPFPEDD